MSRKPIETTDWSIGNAHLKPDGSAKSRDEITDSTMKQWGYDPDNPAHQDFQPTPTEFARDFKMKAEKAKPPTPEHRKAIRDLCFGNPDLDPETGLPINSKDLPAHQRAYDKQ